MQIKHLMGIFVVVIIFALACTKSHETKTSNEKNIAGDIDGWFKAGSKPNSYEIGKSDDKHNDKPVYYIKSIENVDNGFGTIMKGILPGEYSGKRIKLTGNIKSENIINHAGMWMRVDGSDPNNMLAFDNMYDRPIKGSNNWQKYEIVLDVADSSTAISYGLLLNGNGHVWISDFILETVGKDVPTTDRLKDK